MAQATRDGCSSCVGGKIRSASKRGFTLIELLVVIAIIALLISILIPSLSQAREQSKRAVCSSHLRSLVQMTHVYAQNNNDFVPIGRASNYYWVNYWFVDNTDTPKPEFYMFGALYAEGLIPDGRVAYCPSQMNTAKYGYNNVDNPWPPTLTVRSTSDVWSGTRAGYSMRPEYFVANNNTSYKAQYPKLFQMGNACLFSDLICDQSYVVTGHKDTIAKATADGAVYFVKNGTKGPDGKTLAYQEGILKSGTTYASKSAATTAMFTIFDMN